MLSRHASHVTQMCILSARLSQALHEGLLRVTPVSKTCTPRPANLCPSPHQNCNTLIITLQVRSSCFAGQSVLFNSLLISHRLSSHNARSSTTAKLVITKGYPCQRAVDFTSSVITAITPSPTILNDLHQQHRSEAVINRDCSGSVFSQPRNVCTHT
jgi:hypothetical protein